MLEYFFILTRPVVQQAPSSRRSSLLFFGAGVGVLSLIVRLYFHLDVLLDFGFHIVWIESSFVVLAWCVLSFWSLCSSCCRVLLTDVKAQ